MSNTVENQNTAENNTSSSNPFEGFFNETSEGISGSNAQDYEGSQQTTESIIDNSNTITGNIGNSDNGEEADAGYNPINIPDGNETGTNPDFIVPTTAENTTESGISLNIAKWMNVGGIAVAASAALATAVVITYFANKGFSQSERIVRSESKINANTKKYYTIRKLQRVYNKLNNVEDDIKVIKIQKQADKLKAKIKNNSNTRLKQAKLKKYLINESLSNTATASNKKFKNVISEDFGKKETRQHLQAMKQIAIAEVILERNKKNAKAANKHLNKAEKSLESLKFGDLTTGLHFANVKFKSAENNDNLKNAPLYLTRAISDKQKVVNVFDKAHKTFPLAQKDVKFCVISLKSSQDETTQIDLKCAFDNELGFNVCRSALIAQAMEEIKEKEDLKLDTVEILDYSSKSKHDSQLPDTYNLNDENAKEEFFQLCKDSLNEVATFNKKFLNKDETFNEIQM